MKNKKSLGLYIHVPFCVQKCAYCDFYSRTDRQQAADYVKAVCRDLAHYGKACGEYTVDTLYFGGGTPSCLGGEALCRLLDQVRQHFTLAAQAEITVEANPESMSAAFLREIHQAGFNRLSMGIQSSDDRELKALGRVHTFDQARRAFCRAREAGFDNISVDLMYGLPGQTMESWRQSLTDVLALDPTHISCYGLKLEPGTPLYQAQPELPDDDSQADFYLAACDRLRQAGFVHYEISNFAKAGRESRHNSRYWDLSQYLGIGPGAHSFWQGRRFAWIRDLDAYIQGTDSCGGPILEEEEEVAGFSRSEEYLMLMLRTSRGVSGEIFEQKFQRAFKPYEQGLNSYKKLGFAENHNGYWRLTETGFLVSNAILGDILQVRSEEERL